MPVIDERQVRTASAVNQRFNESSKLSDPLAHGDLRSLFEEIERVADLPLSQAQTMPREAYTSEAFFSWEMDHLFRAGWVCVAHESQLLEVGDFINLEFLGEPLMVIRDKSRQVQVLSRTCPHRGMDIMPPGFGHDGHGPAEFRQGGEGRGHTRLLLCPYHAWTFELDGQLKACPEMGQAEGFERCQTSLKTFRSEVWHGFVFVNLDGEASESVSVQLSGLEPEMERWNPGAMEMAFEAHWDIPCNWKVLAENFMESYHHAGAHAKTLQPLMPARHTWTEQENPYYIRCHLPYGTKARKELASSEARGEQWDAFPPVGSLTDAERHEWGLIMGFPLFTMVLARDQVVWYRIEPVEPNRLRLMTSVLVPPSTIAHPDYEHMLKRGRDEATAFHLEDMEMLAAVQRGLHASGYQRGRLSHLEMPIWLIQRYLAAAIRGKRPTWDREVAPSQRPD